MKHTKKAAKKNLFALANKIQARNTQYDADKALNDVTEAVEEVRSASSLKKRGNHPSSDRFTF